MMPPQVHPSFLELDLLAADAAQPSTRAHVAGCTQCQEHLGRLQHQVHVPAWVRTGRPPQPVRARWPLFALAAAAACALVVAGVMTRPASSGPSDGEKAFAPGVLLYVKHDERVAQWEPRQSVAPGDSLRLQVSPHGYTHLRVSSGGAVLYEGELAPQADELLPVSWRVDESPGDETLDVTLSGAGQPEWTRHLVLPKQVAP